MGDHTGAQMFTPTTQHPNSRGHQTAHVTGGVTGYGNNVSVTVCSDLLLEGRPGLLDRPLLGLDREPRRFGGHGGLALGLELGLPAVLLRLDLRLVGLLGVELA